MVLRAHVMLCDRVAFFENNIFDLKMGKMEQKKKKKKKKKKFFEFIWKFCLL